MTDTYNDALQEQLKNNIWERLAEEATSMSNLEYLTIAVDIAGIFDPTFFVDAGGTVLSLVQRDFIGAGLSAVSMVPYGGDALAKTAKIGKVAPKTARAIEAYLTAVDNLARAGRTALKDAGFTLEQVAAARKKALERVQKVMLDARNKVPGCKDCEKLIDVDGTSRRMIMPANGRRGQWKTPDGKQPTDGNGTFEFTNERTLPDGRTVKSIEYRNGAPNFDDFVEGQKHELWEVNGSAAVDGEELKRMMRETDPNWEAPNPKDFVLHHFEDGQVGYVPREIHDTLSQGASHTGGNSMTNNQLF